MKLKINLALLLCGLFLQSCMYDSAQTLANDEIDAKLRKQIKQKNDSLLIAMSDSDIKIFRALGSPDFVKYLTSRLDKSVWAFRKGYLDTKYKVYNEYHNTHGTVPNNSQIENLKDKYVFTFKNNTKETYVSLLQATYEGISDYMITVIYELHDGKWKVNKVNVGLMGQFGKNAAENFAIAKRYKDEGHLVNALFYCDIAKGCMDPADNMLKYEDAERMEYYSKQWADELNKKYPMPTFLENVSSTPQILDIKPVVNPEGIFTMISYRTAVPLSDEEVINMEYNDVKKEMRKVFPDIDFNQKYVYFRAYNPNVEYTGPNGEDYREFKEVNK